MPCESEVEVKQLLQAGTAFSPTNLLEKKSRIIPEATPVVLTGVQIANIFLLQKNILEHEATRENIRELRIQFRRLRSLLKFFQPLLSKDGADAHSEHLRQWGMLLGSIRDIDVLLTSWEKFTHRFAPIFSASDQWLDPFRERREFLTHDILHRIRQGELTQHLFSLQEWLYLEQEKPSSPEEERDLDYQVRKQLLLWVKKIREELPDIQGTSKLSILHHFRIRAKQLRYVQESLNEVSRYQDFAFSAVLKKIQSQIGNIHDYHQIKSLIEKLDAGSMDDRVIREKELFLSWRSRGAIEDLTSLAITMKGCRQTVKQRLRSLAALRSDQRAKPRHNSCAHEPGE